jgi:Holliday junction resolvase RusA-like endonuclease
MKLTIMVSPVPKARARTIVRNGRVMSFTPKNTQDAENAIRAQIMDLKPFGAGLPLDVKLEFYITKPPSVNKKRIYPVIRPDIDNYQKLVFDALNGYLIPDDSQIIKVEAAKYYGSPPRIDIEIQEVITQ